MNRYIPVIYRVWIAIMEHYPGYTQEMCDRTAFIEVLAFSLSAWLAQMALMIRIYAVSGKNLPIAFCLITASTVHLGVGCWHMVLLATNPALPIRPVPGLAIQFCTPSRHRALEIANTALSIPYDSLVFGITVYYSWKQAAAHWSLEASPSLFHTLFRDGFIYFLFIFVNHIMCTVALVLGQAHIIPGVGLYVYVPLAISRLMISLRRAAIKGDDLVFYSRSRNQLTWASAHLATEVEERMEKRDDTESIRPKEAS